MSRVVVSGPGRCGRANVGDHLRHPERTEAMSDSSPEVEGADRRTATSTTSTGRRCSASATPTAASRSCGRSGRSSGPTSCRPTCTTSRAWWCDATATAAITSSFVLDGGVWIGGQWCTPGTHVHVPLGATFGPIIAGPDGVTCWELSFGEFGGWGDEHELYEREIEARGVTPLPDPPLELGDWFVDPRGDAGAERPTPRVPGLDGGHRPTSTTSSGPRSSARTPTA